MVELIFKIMDTRVQALGWWNRLFTLTKIKMCDKYYSGRFEDTLTGREIEYIWHKENPNKMLSDKKPTCPICMDTGYYTIGGSFGGATQIQKCDCKTT
jgi:hypothetical protein